jgi:LPXTG-site transpeptidase (sortase) family protein
MSPIKLLGTFFALNLLAVGSAITLLTPSTPKNLELQNMSIQRPVQDMPKLVSGKPENLTIKSVGVNLEVEDGVYDPVSQNWTLSPDKAHFALMTAEANNMVGNTFMYGHNNRKVFASLDKISVGDEARIKSSDKTFVYKFTRSREVVPEDVSVFEYKGKSILTIQTCSGSWYEKRKLFTFEFVKVEA